MPEVTKTELEVSPRAVLGKKVKQLRRHGVVPANVYGNRVDSLAIQVPVEELRHVLRTAGRNEIVYLRLDGQELRPTFIRTVQRDAVTDAILHVDFYQISLKEKVRLEVRLHLVGVAPAVDLFSGTLLHGLDSITVEGLPIEIPSHIEVDVSGLEQIDHAIHVRDLDVPANLTVLTDPELVVAKVAPPAVERVEEVEAVAEEAAPAEGAPAAEAEAAESQE
ncbi:MAG TPA: 50S ribosomal protein L25 [Dehalococcoidia bacterium]|nr:50S ribosomal protein L25 [Dehalococcoidia bacterium]